MKKCENCKNEHDGSYGSGRFCTSKCARGFSTKAKRKEINEKVSNFNKGKIYPNRKMPIDDVLNEINLRRKKTWHNKFINTDFNLLSTDLKRRMVILEQNGKCNNCKNDKWLGYDIILELEHIDGNHSNNERENLEALCPNCHSLTSTWRGRNKKNKRNKISDKKLLVTLIKHDFNMRQSLLEVGLAAKGGNYKRCHKLKREYDELE